MTSCVHLQRPAAARRPDATSEGPFAITAAQIAHLEAQGYLIMDGVMSNEQVCRARHEAEKFKFFPTGQHGDAVRTDEVRWLRCDVARYACMYAYVHAVKC